MNPSSSCNSVRCLRLPFRQAIVNSVALPLFCFAVLACSGPIAKWPASANQDGDAAAGVQTQGLAPAGRDGKVTCCAEGCVGHFAEVPRGALALSINVADATVAPQPPFYLWFESRAGEVIPVLSTNSHLELELPSGTYDVLVSGTFAHETRKGPYGQWLAASDLAIDAGQLVSVTLESPAATHVTGEVAGETVAVGGLRFVRAGQTPLYTQPDVDVDLGKFDAVVLSGTYDVYFATGRRVKNCTQKATWTQCLFGRAADYRRIATAVEVTGPSLELRLDSNTATAGPVDSSATTEPPPPSDQQIAADRFEVVFPDPARWTYGYDLRFASPNGGHTVLPVYPSPVQQLEVRTALPSGEYEVQLRSGNHLSPWRTLGALEVVGQCR